MSEPTISEAAKNAAIKLLPGDSLKTRQLIVQSAIDADRAARPQEWSDELFDKIALEEEARNSRPLEFAKAICKKMIAHSSQTSAEAAERTARAIITEFPWTNLQETDVPKLAEIISATTVKEGEADFYELEPRIPSVKSRLRDAAAEMIEARVKEGQQ
jgi:hypothetical protein